MISKRIFNNRCQCDMNEAMKPPVHIFSTFGHCLDFPNECIAGCAGHSEIFEGECLSLNNKITEICPCNDNIVKSVHFKKKNNECVNFQNSCFAECAGITKFRKGRCPN